MKKILALLMALVMVVSLLAACSKAPAESTTPAAPESSDPAPAPEAEKEKVTLKVWADQGELPLIEQLCEAFAAEHSEKEYSFEFGAVGAVDGKTRYLEDPAAAADVFLYADDQLVDLVKADALYEVTRNADAIIAANTPGSINAASYEGTLYGYPMTSDNGYFLYYDKSVFTEDDLATLDGILAAANAAGKQVHMDVSNGWYLASFFLGNGCTLTIEDGKQVIDFNNEKGLAAAEAIRAFCNNSAFVTGDDSVLAGGIGDAIACGVSGTWMATAIQEKLGDNYGCCKLPTFTCAGEQVQMGSFLGCKIYGVNSLTAYPVDAMELAEYLTNEAAQIERYKVLNYGPSNINALADETIAANLALQALSAQSEFAVSQMVLGGFWTPAEAFGLELEAHSTADLQTMLDQLVEQALAG
ncbi:MAG: extracellular solute-binding protein [Oscillospiraceae bacterium]|nr:extracellular solute-binding protein [Oscillospiraceae bacterium]